MLRYLPELVFLLRLCWCKDDVSVSDGCPAGWFGVNCEYKCHCNGSCIDGECQYHCESGWFGFKCQYQDLVTDIPETIIPIHAYTSLTDTDVDTCIHYTSVTVDLTDTYPVSWIRMVVKQPELIYKLRIHFQDNTNQYTECTTQKKDIVIKGHTVDIQLTMKDRVRYITMEGEVIQNLCLLRISGGRNVALKQSTSQTSTYGNNERYVSSKAVDGISDGQDIANSCTNTNSGDRSPSWTITFHPTRLITRIVIYNRKEAPVHLKRFRLQMFNESNRNIFRYTHLNSLVQQVHTILPLAASPTKTLTIIALTQKEGLYLALCEVEAYGECSRGLWGLECNNTCDNDCPNNCRFDDGSCTDVCFGFENPPVCNKTCAADKWGENCNKTCDRNCHNSACNIMTGQCEEGCRPGYEMPDCKKNCARGTWGFNCQNICSSNCYIKDYCDKATGECIAGCESGYKQPLCDTPAGPKLNTTLVNYVEEATTENVPHDNLNIGVASLAGFLGFIVLICGIMVAISYLRKKYLCDRNHVANADVNLYANINS